MRRRSKFSSQFLLTFPLSISCTFYFNFSPFLPLHVWTDFSRHKPHLLPTLATLTNSNAHITTALLGTPSVIRWTVVLSTPPPCVSRTELRTVCVGTLGQVLLLHVEPSCCALCGCVCVCVWCVCVRVCVVCVYIYIYTLQWSATTHFRLLGLNLSNDSLLKKYEKYKLV